jgi:hypothetical protein
MAITIKETFTVEAPIERVWQFVMDPEMVVTCMPGAELEEVLDGKTFLGKVSVKVGAITTSYSGKVTFTLVDAEGHNVEMTAEGTETGGGTAKGTMSSRLQTLDSGETEVVIESTVDLTGRIMQVGRGMIQGVSHQLFLQFVASAKERLEAAEGEAEGEMVSEPASAAAEPISILPLLTKTLWSAVTGFFGRLFRRPGA